MRKYILVAVLVLGGGAWAAEEGPDTKPMRLGIQAGMTFSDVNSPAQFTPSNRTGLAFGLNLELNFNPFFAVQPELLYVQRGTTLLDTGNVKVNIKYDSIELPVLAKLKFGTEIAPFLVAGPVAIFNMNKSLMVEGAGTTTVTFRPKDFDFAVALGGGVDIGPIFAIIRYNLGIVNIDENSAQYKSRGFHLLAGIRF